MSSSAIDSPPTSQGSVDVTMPQMGVSVAEGTLVGWNVSVGDRVSADQTICEVSSDKIDTEVPAPAGGVVAEILVELEETVAVGTVLARISTEDTSEASQDQPIQSASGGTTAATVTTEEPAPSAQPPAPVSIFEDEDAQLDLAGGGRGGFVKRAHADRYYSPVVQRIAAEQHVDLARLEGTGLNGRVTKKDVLAASTAVDPPMHIESPYRPDPPAVPPPAAAAGATLSRMRRQIGEHMKRSQQTAATCTTWIEADMTRVESARAGSGLTALPYLAAATIAALRAHPALNATLEGERYTVHREVNLGIAVSLGEDGLIVPVIHNAHELSVEGLSVRIRELARRARAGQLAPDEVRGGTFTITNPGQYGSIMATPVINQPQVGILDLEAIVRRPVVIAGPDGGESIGIRSMTILGLSWDHRALDGVLSAQFLATVRDELERR